MIELLAKFELFQGLWDEAREELVPYLEERWLRSGQVLFRAGEESEELLLVADGELCLEQRGEPLGVMRPGDLLGAASLAAIGSRECDAVAQGPVLLLVLTRESYMRLKSDQPQTALALQEAIVCELASLVRASVGSSAQA